MKISFVFEENEQASNIGIAKAMTESGLFPNELQEIARYLLVYAENRFAEDPMVQVARRGEK